MTKLRLASRALAALALLGIAFFAYRALRHEPPPAVVSQATPAGAATPAKPPESVPEPAPDFLYGRVTTVTGARYVGRLRFGGDQEAFWGDTFNGRKTTNPWLGFVSPDVLPKERRPLSFLGFVLTVRERPMRLDRPFVSRFGDLARLEAVGKSVRVTLKSGTRFDLDRFEASDFDDGVRVWDEPGRAVDLDSLEVQTIEFLPTPPLVSPPRRLFGTVRTRQGEFTGPLTWERGKSVGADELVGGTAEGTRRLAFEELRSIVLRTGGRALVTLDDGREIELAGLFDGGRGISVEDARWGRMLISWDAFERVDFQAGGGSGPAYGDFPPGRPLLGTVVTLDGRRLAGRLVFDLDESETTDTLEAPAGGVVYSLPFDRIASIVPPGATSGLVTLHGGDTLSLEASGDLAPGNGGLLVFADGSAQAEYVPWAEVGRIDLGSPAGR